MQDWMRKHRRLIFFFIFIFIGIPFVFMWGKPTSPHGNQAADSAVLAQVGGVPIKESEFRRGLDAAAQARSRQGGDRPSYTDLDKDGTAQAVLEQLVDASLLRIRAAQRNFSVDKRVLEKQMQQWGMFQDENGVFNHEIWNEWIASVERWNEIYDELEEVVGRQMYLSAVSAPAHRIIAAKAQNELKSDNIKIKVKFAKIEPQVAVSDDDARKHYDENPEAYRLPEQYKAEFIAYSLTPDVPEQANELVARIRAGEDFVAVAKEYSGQDEEDSSDLGWSPVNPDAAPYMKALYALEPGAVSDPVWGPLGYHIFKNEEIRINPDTEEKEVHGRQIVVPAMMTPEEAAIREKALGEIAKKIQDGEDAASAAAAAGLSLQQTSFFGRTSTEIEPLSMNDLFTFRSQVIAQKDTPWTVLKGRDNLFITHIIETAPGTIPEFAEVEQDARDNFIAQEKRSEAYLARIDEYAKQIKESKLKIDSLAGAFPDIVQETGETPEAFTRKDTLFQQKIYVQANEIVAALQDALPGDIAGPIKGFFGDAWFFELVEKTEPTEEELAALSDELKNIEARLAQNAEYEIMSDFMKDLRERMLASVAYQQNNDVLDRVLSRGKYAIEEREPEKETAPVDAAASAADSSPGESAGADAAAAAETADASGSEEDK
jgi:parvulin-like peptidyl-prolyl isomerase